MNLGPNELHTSALEVLTEDFKTYYELKPEIDKVTEYGVDTNGAHKILCDLVEFGYAERHVETLYRSGTNVPRGSVSSFRLTETK